MYNCINTSRSRKLISQIETISYWPKRSIRTKRRTGISYIHLFGFLFVVFFFLRWGRARTGLTEQAELHRHDRNMAHNVYVCICHHIHVCIYVYYCVSVVRLFQFWPFSHLDFWGTKTGTTQALPFNACFQCSHCLLHLAGLSVRMQKAWSTEFWKTKREIWCRDNINCSQFQYFRHNTLIFTGCKSLSIW